MRRSLIAIVGVLVLATIGAAAYYYLTTKTPAVMVAPTIELPGGQPAQNQPSAVETPANQTQPQSTAPQRLMQLTKGPVVPGFAVLNVPQSTSTSQVSVSYLERQSGNVFSYNVDANTITRTSNRTVPGLQSAIWSRDGSLAIVRYLSGDTLSTINTYAIRPDGSGGFFLPQDLSDVSLASSSILTLASGVNGSVASTVDLNGARTTTVFSSPLSSLRTYPLGGGRYLGVTKPSGTLAGYAFIYDTSKIATRIFGPQDGLVALPSPSGSYVFFSYVQNSALRTAFVDMKTGAVSNLPLSTIADKCVWTADEKTIYCGVPTSPNMSYNYPDDWYQGAVSFTDRIWKVDVQARFVELVLDFAKSTGSNLDAKALATDRQNTTLVFMNKNDGSLWSYRL